MGGGELVPRVGPALLDAERDAPSVFVDVQHHHLHLVAGRDHLGGVDVLVRPVHFGNVDEPFHALFDLREAAVVGEVGDRGQHAAALAVAAGDVHPRIVAELLHA